VIVDEHLSIAQRLLRIGTFASVGATSMVIFLMVKGILVPFNSKYVIVGPAVASVILAAASNAMDVPLMPAAIRRRFQSGVRDRLWRSRVGAWLARRLGAPERSRVGAGAFRATEVALGVAAADLYAALPKRFREQLSELPATVAALEARAAEARAELDELAALAPSDSAGGELLAERRAAAASRLASTVAALEGVRLDLLRLHANADDVAPLTTLIDAARLLGDDIGRLADAQREVAAKAPNRPLGAGRVPTPA
jgi:serine/threonine-protein kinase